MFGNVFLPYAAEVESDRKAVQYELQANEILRRTNQTNAAVVARGFAGGTQGFELQLFIQTIKCFIKKQVLKLHA